MCLLSVFVTSTGLLIAFKNVIGIGLNWLSDEQDRYV